MVQCKLNFGDTYNKAYRFQMFAPQITYKNHLAGWAYLSTTTTTIFICPYWTRRFLCVSNLLLDQMTDDHGRVVAIMSPIPCKKLFVPTCI